MNSREFVHCIAWRSSANAYKARQSCRFGSAALLALFSGCICSFTSRISLIYLNCLSYHFVNETFRVVRRRRHCSHNDHKAKYKHKELHWFASLSISRNGSLTAKSALLSLLLPRAKGCATIYNQLKFLHSSSRAFELGGRKLWNEYENAKKRR